MIGGLPLSTASVPTCFGTTVSWIGPVGTIVFTPLPFDCGGASGPKPRKARLYVPGTALACVVSINFCSSLPGAKVNAANVTPGGNSVGSGVIWKLPLNSASIRFSFIGISTLSPTSTTNLSLPGVTLIEALFRSETISPRSSLVMLGLLPWALLLPQTTLAGRPSRTTFFPSIVAVAMTFTKPSNFSGALSPALSTRWTDLVFAAITCGGQVTPAGSPSIVSVISPLKPSMRTA